MHSFSWVACPLCNHPHMIKVRDDTLVKHFPAFCKHCKRENIINIEPKSRITIEK